MSKKIKGKEIAKKESYEVTKLNAVSHGILSKYTLLPWENADEYESVLSNLSEDYRPNGATEQHLVEELAGIIWRKRRLRLTEAATWRRGLASVTRPPSSYESSEEPNVVAAAITRLTSEVRLDNVNVRDMLALTPETVAQKLSENQQRIVAVRAALKLLTHQTGTYESAVDALDAETREDWQAVVAEWKEELALGYEPGEDDTVWQETKQSLMEYLEDTYVPHLSKEAAVLSLHDEICRQAVGSAFPSDTMEKLARYETHLDRKFERTLAMLIRLQVVRRETNST